MPGHDIIVIGASAGGVEALVQVVQRLPADLPASVFIVLHVPPHSRSVLPLILQRKTSLPVEHAKDNQAFEPGRIYVASPDNHLLVKRGTVRVVRGPHENSSRPAVDPLFRTAARAYGPRVIGVVLSGALDDGTAGLLAIKRRGGIAIVQDPDEALYSGMPGSAVDNVAVDHVLALADIGETLARLAKEPAIEQTTEQEDIPMSNGDDELEMEADIAEMNPGAMHATDRPGNPSVFACPHCHGSLFELRDGQLTRFRCRTGHAYSPESLLAAQSDGVEGALWTALRALEEKAALLQRMLERGRERGQKSSMNMLSKQIEQTEAHAEVLRKVLERDDCDAQADIVGNQMNSGENQAGNRA
jgi:two-component system chemotaxis response regulator CheB